MKISRVPPVSIRRTHDAARRLATRVVCASVACTVLACSSSTAPANNNGGGGGGKTTGSGSLAVTVTAPNGVTPSVTVTGPNNYSKTVTATATLSSLATGSYTITAGTGLTADSIVSIGYAGSVTGSPATVAAGATAAATVSYAAPWSMSGVMWVANESGNSITGFTSADLKTAGTPTPAVTVGSGGSSSTVQSALAVVVDQTGGMWIAANGTDTLYYYKSTQIAHSTNAAPSVRLVDTTLQEPIALALDSHGNLWVADEGTSKLVEFTTTQMAAGGTATPAVELTSTIGSISRPFDIAFDGHGDLWVANYGDSTVVGFSPAQIATSGRPLPYAALSGAQGTTNCLTIAFDAQGDLWVGTLSDSVSEYTPSQLTSIGAPTPAVVLALGHTVEEIQSLAFDNSGALWVLDNQRNKLLRYAPDQLTTSGAPMAADTINVGTNAFPQWIAFSPHAAGLPLN